MIKRRVLIIPRRGNDRADTVLSTIGSISRWFLILSGWVQATIFAAVVVDRFKNKAP